MQFNKANGYRDGDYHLENEGRARWAIHYKGEFIGRRGTVKLAVEVADAHALQLQRVADSNQRQAKSAAELVAIRKLAATAKEFDPSWGIPWHEWAELRIGSTPEDLTIVRQFDRATWRAAWLAEYLDRYDDSHYARLDDDRKAEWLRNIRKVLNQAAVELNGRDSDHYENWLQDEIDAHSELPCRKIERILSPILSEADDLRAENPEAPLPTEFTLRISAEAYRQLFELLQITHSLPWPIENLTSK